MSQPREGAVPWLVGHSEFFIAGFMSGSNGMTASASVSLHGTGQVSLFGDRRHAFCSRVPSLGRRYPGQSIAGRRVVSCVSSSSFFGVNGLGKRSFFLCPPFVPFCVARFFRVWLLKAADVSELFRVSVMAVMWRCVGRRSHVQNFDLTPSRPRWEDAAQR